MDIEEIATGYNVEIFGLGTYSYVLKPIELLRSSFKNYVKIRVREGMMV